MPSNQDSLRRHVVLPGMLREIIEHRMTEFHYDAFSPFGLELICFDLRIRREHILSLDFAKDPPHVQEAIDRELVRHYRPGGKRHGYLYQALSSDGVPEAPPGAESPRGSFSSFRTRIQSRELLDPCIQTRWRELGYDNFSAYVTGLVRYDLMLLGPHRYYSGHDRDPELLLSLDRGTLREFLENKPKPTLLDVLIDKKVGRRLTIEERRDYILQVAADFREMAVKPRGKARN